MKILKNNRHELFALAIVKGMSQKDAAIQAGYKPSRARFTGSNLATYSNIIERIKELQGAATSSDIMDVRERREKLSAIARPCLTDFVEATEEGSHIDIGKDTKGKAAIQEVTTTHQVGDKGGRSPAVITKLKLHDPIRAISELNKMGGDYPPSKVEIEPGKELGAALASLLSRLRGYGHKD